jgi:hypothetical protein
MLQVSDGDYCSKFTLNVGVINSLLHLDLVVFILALGQSQIPTSMTGLRQATETSTIIPGKARVN